MAHSGWMFAVAPSAANRGMSVGVHDLQVRQVVADAAESVLAARAASTALSALRTARSPSAWKCTWKPRASSSVT